MNIYLDCFEKAVIVYAILFLMQSGLTRIVIVIVYSILLWAVHRKDDSHVATEGEISGGNQEKEVKATRPQGRYKKRERGKLVNAYSANDLDGILVTKLTMIPVSCILEVIFDKMQYSRDTKLSIALVLLGVGVCTVTDVSVNTNGFIAAAVAIWSIALQQYYVHFLQRKYSLRSFNLLSHTAPAQAATLLLVRPFLDYWMTSKRINNYN